jgi:hypothetical protein
MLHFRCRWNFCWLIVLAPAALAQSTPSTPAAQAGSPVPYASVSQLNLLLSEVEQTSQTMQGDLSKLRIDKWKTDSGTKRGTQTDVESLQRNLQSALPEIIGQLRSSPENLTATFKLYRNLDALYGVFSSVAESTGAFGSKDEYQSLQNDLEALSRSRKSFADRMETLSDTKESEIGQLRTQLHDAQAKAAAAAPPQKKVVVDDTQPAPKPPVKKTTKKKPVPKPPSATQQDQGATPASTQPAPAQPQPQ